MDPGNPKRNRNVASGTMPALAIFVTFDNLPFRARLGRRQPFLGKDDFGNMILT